MVLWGEMCDFFSENHIKLEMKNSVTGWAIFGLNWLDYIMYILITMLLIRLYRVNNVFLVSVNVIITKISIQI
jgi:hypothetical protein